MADTPITVPVGSLSLSEETVKFANSGDNKLVLTGYAPTLATAIKIPVGTGSIAFAGLTAIRSYGLQFLSDAPSLKIDRFRDPGTGSLLFDSDNATTIVTIPASSNVVSPAKAELAFSSDAANVDIIRLGAPAVGSISFTGAAPTIAVEKSLFIFRTAVTVVQSDAPTAVVAYVGGSPGDGTLIQNLDAGPETSNYEICDRTGFKIKPYREGLVEDGYGNFVRPESQDRRHPQERVKSTSEDLRTGALRPEPIGDETFITTPVDPGDL